MQDLHQFLRTLATIGTSIAAMQHQQVAYFLAAKLKVAANMLSTDYVDIADICDDYVALDSMAASDFCKQDIERLQHISKLLRKANTQFHAVQNILLAAQPQRG